MLKPTVWKFSQVCFDYVDGNLRDYYGSQAIPWWAKMVCFCAYQNAQDEGVLQQALDNKNFVTQTMIAAGDEANAVALIRSFFIMRFDVDVETTIETTIGDSQAQNGIFARSMGLFWSAMQKGGKALGTMKDCTMDAIWALARKAFEASMGGHYTIVIQAASWINDIWMRMQVWCNEILEKSAQWLMGFKECLVFGVGIIGVAAVLVLIEKFMIGSHILSGPMNLAQTFVLCFVGYLGVKEGGALVTSGISQQISRLVGACQNVVKSISQMMSADATNAQTNPIQLLEAFSKCLTGFSAESLIQTGRVFNSATQIKNGCVTLWACVSQISEFLWDLLDKGFGIKSKALADLSVMLGHDVQGWLRRCDAACEHMCLFPSVPQDILKNFKTLKHIGLQIRSGLMDRTERGSVAALACVNKALDKLTTLIVSATLAGSGGPRYEPLWVAFTGAPGVGKSTAVNVMVARYLADHNLESSDLYARNASDQYWSGYRRQAVVTYDDLGALSNGSTICEEGELIKLVSRDALPLNMASLEEKGMYFDSPLIITSSNFIGFSPHASIHDDQAYYRRRSMLVEVVKKEEVDMDPEQPLAHQAYLLRASNAPFTILQRFETFDDLYAFFVDKQEAHTLKQKQIMASMRHATVTLDSKVGAMATLLPMLMGCVPISINEFVGVHHPGWNFLIYSNGRMNLINDKFELKVVEEFPGIDHEDLIRAQTDALTTAMRYGNVLRTMPGTDPVAAHFLADLVEKDVYGIDLEVRKNLRIEDEQLWEVATGLPKWQRAFVQVLSSVTSIRNQGCFGQIYSQMCYGLQKAYATDVSKWPTIVKVGLGVTAFLIFGKTMLWTLNYLGGFGTGAAFSVAATKAFSQGQSDDEVRKNSSEYRHRNVPIKTRHWSRGQNDDIGFEWLMKHCLVTVRWAYMSCQALVLPGKQLVGVYHFFRKLPDGVIVEVITDDQKYHICWHQKDLKLLENSELSVYRHVTLRDVPSSILKRVQFGLEQMPDVFRAVMCSCKLNDISNEFESEVGSITVKKRNVMLNILAGEYQRLVPVCLEYEANTVNRDCGSLIIAKINGEDRLVGIHVAGINGTGQACFLPTELQISEAQNWFEADHMHDYPDPNSVGDGTIVVGALNMDKRFFTQQKTSYMQTPDNWHLDTPCDKEPAILSKFDERIVGTAHSDYDPYVAGMAKYKDAAGPFECEQLELAALQIEEEWHDAATDFVFEECSTESAINGVAGVEYYDPLVMNTSEGYPYILSREHNKGKARFLVEQDGILVPNQELQAGIDRIEDECAYKVPTLVGIECAKDEKLPLKKIYVEPKTRLFTVLPMDYNIVVRKKFFPFVKFLMTRRDALPCQVGLNPYGREWGRVAVALLEKGDTILCCDYSRFDGIMPKQMMLQIAGMINSLMGGCDRLKQQRVNLLMACCGRYGICAGKVWRVENGIPSGFPLTVIINSVFNELIIRYIYLGIFPNDRLMRSSFGRYVRMVTYGDDNLISISPTITSVFNGEVIQKCAADLHIKITDGVDKSLPNLSFRKLEECDFLKRKFVKDEFGRWRAPMELESLWSQLHWVKTQNLGLNEAYLVNVEAVLRELFLHDVGLAKTMRARVLGIDWIEAKMVPTMEQLEAFHELQMSGSPISHFAYDAMLVPTMLGPIGTTEVEMGDFEFKNMVATVSGKYKFVPGDFVICLRVASKYGEDGIYVDWPANSGRGELPSAVWLKTNVVARGCNILTLIKRMRNEGKRIVFLSRNSNVYSAVFFVLIGLALRILDVTETNMIMSKAISCVRSLGYLVDVFPEAFFSQKKRVYDVDVARRKVYKVFGATNAELNAVRRVHNLCSFENAHLDIPIFNGDVQWQKTLKFLRENNHSGILMRSEFKIDGMNGYPGLKWQECISNGWNLKGTGHIKASVVYFDGINTLICDHVVSCEFVEGVHMNDVVKISGKSLGAMSTQERDKVSPLVCAMQFLMDKLKDGF